MQVKTKGKLFMKSNRKKIPDFKNMEEEVRFWDTHDITDSWEGDKRVKVEFSRNLEHTIGVRLDDKTIDKLEEVSNKRGVGPSTLARMWILEKLNQIP